MELEFTFSTLEDLASPMPNAVFDGNRFPAYEDDKL
jgi:hypothetical protein